jgi:hypothetical protein
MHLGVDFGHLGLALGVRPLDQAASTTKGTLYGCHASTRLHTRGTNGHRYTHTHAKQSRARVGKKNSEKDGETSNLNPLPSVAMRLLVYKLRLHGSECASSAFRASGR